MKSEGAKAITIKNKYDLATPFFQILWIVQKMKFLTLFKLK